MDVLSFSKEIAHSLKLASDHPENLIHDDLLCIPPFVGGGTIKLIIIGQDPTIRNEKSRGRIKVTLNLDKPNSLQNYVLDICRQLGMGLENVYATNLFKYFYTTPPAGTPEVLRQHLDPNLALLRQELALYPGVPVITLGEPVLQLLTDPTQKVRSYWDYNPLSGMSSGQFTLCEASQNKLARDFFPLPHQPSLRKRFYKENLQGYLGFISNQAITGIKN